MSHLPRRTQSTRITRGLQRLTAQSQRRLRALNLAITHRLADERGATTAEYALITLGACLFAGVLIAILRGPEIGGLLTDLISTALRVVS